MTSNQIAFYKAKEEAKHWNRQDTETMRHNFASEALNQQDISVKDWANKANIELGFTNSAINRAHYERQDAINQAHYERSDANAMREGRVKNDQLILNAIELLGTPEENYTLDSQGNRVRVGDSSLIGFQDYYSEGTSPGYIFGTTPLALNYLSPQSIAGYGKAASGAVAIVKAATAPFTK